MMDTLKSEITEYWDRRAPSYTDVIEKNLAGTWGDTWADYLISHFPTGDTTTMQILDIGTGPGFYAIILSRRGCRVTAVDFSEKMLEEAKRNAGDLAPRIRFLKMDAQALEFPDDSFDVIVTRNLTWNLQDPAGAYKEWKRVLRPGGVLLNFDANWYAYLVDGEKAQAHLRDRENVRRLDMEDHDAYSDSFRMEEISRRLPMTRLERPAWDLETLRALGFSSAAADLNAGRTVWNEEEAVNYASTPGFLICAVK